MTVLDVLFHRRQGDDQPVRDLAIGQSLGDTAQQLYRAGVSYHHKMIKFIIT